HETRRPRRAVPSSPRRRTAKAPTPVLAPASIALNSATADDLDRLPGVGPATAQKILDERHRRGGFQSIEELLDVKGIGPAKLAKMRPYLTL
ncbi:helix-hairpin-helix domain-containing protein, partial [bacterium]